MILPYKGKTVEDAGAFYAPYIPLIIGNSDMKIKVHWEKGNPAGYTDDLGIIADRNQWVNERLAGWYTQIPYAQVMEIHEWCEQNLQGYWKLRQGGALERELYMSEEKDVTLFSLRWS